MDKFEKIILLIVAIVLVVSLSYVILILNGVMNGYYSYSFPFIIFVPVTAAAGTIIDFLCGLFTGFSLTMNLGYLIKLRLDKNSNFNTNKKKA